MGLLNMVTEIQNVSFQLSALNRNNKEMNLAYKL